MPSGFKVGVNDLDDLFMPYTSGTKAPNTGFVAGASDISNRYQAIGSGTPRGNTGFKDGATDIAQIFRDINDPLTEVTLSGATVTHDSIGLCTAGIWFNADGTTDRNVGGVPQQINSSTDWIIPNSDADSTYEVRVTNKTGDAWDSSPIADGSWINLGTNRLWYIQVNGGTKTASCTFEIRKDGGAVIDSATYTFNAIST